MALKRVRLDDPRPQSEKRPRSEYGTYKPGVGFHFKKGNPGGPGGNPYVRYVNAFKMATYVAMGEKRWRRLLRIMYQNALMANLGEQVQYAKFMAERIMGKPPQTVVTVEGAPGDPEDTAAWKYL